MGGEGADMIVDTAPGESFAAFKDSSQRGSRGQCD
jgi:hypothetical protein